MPKKTRVMTCRVSSVTRSPKAGRIAPVAQDLDDFRYSWSRVVSNDAPNLLLVGLLVLLQHVVSLGLSRRIEIWFIK
jgi:hypothetical protein